MKQKKLYGEICRNNLSPFNINSKYHIKYTLYKDFLHCQSIIMSDHCKYLTLYITILKITYMIGCDLRLFHSRKKFTLTV